MQKITKIQLSKNEFDSGVIDGSITNAYVEASGGPYGDKEPYNPNVIAVGIRDGINVWAYVAGYKSKEALSDVVSKGITPSIKGESSGSAYQIGDD